MAIPSGVGCFWVSTNASIPAGWTRETTLDARYVKMVPTAGTNPGSTGGSNTHAHPVPSHQHTMGSHTHADAASDAPSATANYIGDPGSAFASPTHTHQVSWPAATEGQAAAATADTGTATNEPPHLVVIAIKSDGTPSGFPANAVVFYNGAAPTGWTAYANAANRALKGAAAAGDGGATGGTSDAHTHDISHTHSASATSHSHATTLAATAATAYLQASNGNLLPSAAHTHTGITSGTVADGGLNNQTVTSASGDAAPPWYKLRAIENTSGGASYLVNAIVWYGGTIASIPAGYKICDGNNGTPNVLDKFIRGASADGEVGNTGGAATHTHTVASHTHDQPTHTGHTGGTSGGSAGTVDQGGNPLSSHSTNGHTHSISASGVSSAATSGSASAAPNANTSNLPAYTEVVYLQVQTQPSSPTITVPLATTTYSGVVILTCSATDPDSTWYSVWEYRRGAGAWTSIGTGTTVASGANSTLSWNTDPLTNATDYEVQVKAVDGDGSASAYVSSGTFTINYLPTVTSLNTPVSGASYSTTMTLSATLADQDSDTVTAEFEYSSNSGGAWSSIGDGTTVAAGSASTRTWDLSALTPGINYRVRVRARDALNGLSGYTSTTDFLIGPSLAAIFADKNTAFYFATKNTAQYFAVKA